jgi:hypothetical protein
MKTPKTTTGKRARLEDTLLKMSQQLTTSTYAEESQLMPLLLDIKSEIRELKMEFRMMQNTMQNNQQQLMMVQQVRPHFPLPQDNQFYGN